MREVTIKTYHFWELDNESKILSVNNLASLDRGPLCAVLHHLLSLDNSLNFTEFGDFTVELNPDVFK
jgi:hypothetical protein